MRTAGAFELIVEPEADARPLRVSICLSGALPDARGIVQMTPACMTLDALEGYINALQDELDLLRVRAREAFSGTSAGHA